MKKNSLRIMIVIMILVASLSLYTTYAYNEDKLHLEPTDADYNIIYTLQENTKNQVRLEPNEEKYLNIVLTNTYDRTVKYGIYYYVLGNMTNSNYIEVKKTEDSIDMLEDIIEPNATKSISIKVKNNGKEVYELVTGALIGFEKGKIEDLIKEGEILVK